MCQPPLDALAADTNLFDGLFTAAFDRPVFYDSYRIS
jgi:hypothetical protein